MIDPLTTSMMVKTTIKEVGKRVAKELGRQALREGTSKAIDATESDSLTKIRKPIEGIANAMVAKEVSSAKALVGEKISKYMKNGPEDILFALDKNKIGPFTRNVSINFPYLRNSGICKVFDCVFSAATTGEMVFAKELPPSNASNPIGEVLRLAQISNSEKGFDRLGLVLPTENKTAINALSALLSDLRLNPKTIANGKATLVHFDKMPLSPQIVGRIETAAKELGKKIESLERETVVAELRDRLLPLYQELCNNISIQKLNSINKLCTFSPQVGMEYFASEPRIMFVGRSVNGWPGGLDADILNNKESFGLNWIQNKWTSAVAKEWAGNKSPFWRVIRATTEKFYHNDWNEHIVYSNLFKISPQEGGNPGAALKKLQHEISQKILNTELDVLKPQVIVAQTGENWMKGFKETIVGDVQGELFSHIGNTIKVFKGNGRLLIVCDRPEGKSEAPLVECIHAAIEKYR